MNTNVVHQALMGSYNLGKLFEIPKLPPISHHGKLNEIIGKFGEADQLRNAVIRMIAEFVTVLDR